MQPDDSPGSDNDALQAGTQRAHYCARECASTARFLPNTFAGHLASNTHKQRVQGAGLHIQTIGSRRHGRARIIENNSIEFQSFSATAGLRAV